MSVYYADLLSRHRLASKSLVLPLFAPWRVPEFLRLCDIVCFLEHLFPIPFHLPRIPREVMAAGPCLVCSREVAAKQPFYENLVDGKNIVLIDDPRDTSTLAERLEGLIDQPRSCRSIGRHGVFLSRVFEGSLSSSDATADAIECSLPVDRTPPCADVR